MASEHATTPDPTARAPQPFTNFKAYWDRCLGMPYPPPLPLPEPPAPLPAVRADVSSLALDDVDWFMTREQEASTEALAHRWDPSGAEGVRRLEGFLDTVRWATGGSGRGAYGLVLG